MNETMYSATMSTSGPPSPPQEVEKSATQENLRKLFTPELPTLLIRAIEEKKLTPDVFQSLTQSLTAARIPADNTEKIARLSGAQKLTRDNLTLRLDINGIPAAYKPYLDSYPIQLALATCEDVESFEKFVHILTVSLSNAESIAHSKLPEFDREAEETYPPVGKRLKSTEAGYSTHVGIKCRILDTLSHRYALSEVEGEQSVFSLLKTTSGVDQTQDRSIARELRRMVLPAQPDRLISPIRKPNAPPFALVPLQEKAFNGSEKFIGIHPYLQRVDVRGSLRKVFAVILPTGVGKTITSAELMAQVYHHAISEHVQNQKGTGRNEALLEKPPALLFIAPQREIVTQSARAYHGFLTDQYEIQTISSIITGGKRKETKWAEVQKVVAPYKQRVQEQFEAGALVVPPSGPLAGQTQENIQELLLTHWEDVMQLSQMDYYADFNTPHFPKGEIITDHELMIRDLRIIAQKSNIIAIHETETAFRHAVTRRFERLTDGLKRKTAKDVKEWTSIEKKYRESQRLEENDDSSDSNGNHHDNIPTKSVYTPAFIQNRLSARWDDILSPFNIDDAEVRVLREIVSTLKITIPPMYKDLVALTLDCQAGMIRKPDPRDYTFDHLDPLERQVRKDHPFVAAFSTIQALYSEERLNGVIEDLSEGGTRKVWVIFDEAHHIGQKAKANEQVFFNVLQNPLVDTVFGMTASDVRADGQRVTDYFERAVAKATLLEAVEGNRLQKFTLVQPAADESQFTLGQVEEITSKKAEKSKERLNACVDDLVARIRDIEDVRRGAKLITDVFPGLSEDDQKLWNDGLNDYWSRQILGFCNDIPSAKFVTQLLNERGVKAAAIFGDTPMDERNKIKQQYRNGELNSIILVGVGREGLDLPQTTMGVIFGSVGSPVTLQQIFGRFLRKHKGPPTLILDYSVPKSQEYHAQLLANQFAVDVVGFAPRDSRGDGEKDVGEPSPKTRTAAGVDLLATLSVGADAIHFGEQKIFAASHIQLVSVEAPLEVAVVLPERTVLETEKAISENLSTPEVENTQPYADVTVTTRPPDFDSLAFLMNKKIKVEVDINETTDQGEQRLWGTAAIRRTDEGAEISFTLRPPEEMDSISPAEMHKRLQKILEAKGGKYELVKQWELIFSGNDRKGKGSIDIPETTTVSGEKQEINLQIEGKEIKILARRKIEYFDKLYSNIDITAECLLSALIPEQRSIKLEVNLAAQVKELLEDKRLAINWNIEAVSNEMITRLENTRWRYSYSRKTREEEMKKTTHITQYDQRTREVEYTSNFNEKDIQASIECTTSIDSPFIPSTERSYWLNKEFCLDFDSKKIDISQYSSEFHYQKLVPKFRLIGLTTSLRENPFIYDAGDHTYINYKIEAETTEQHIKLFPGLFLNKESPKVIIEIGVNVPKPNSTRPPKVGIMIRNSYPEFNTPSYSRSQQQQYLQECVFLSELIGSSFLKPDEKMNVTFEKEIFTDGVRNDPTAYEIV